MSGPARAGACALVAGCGLLALTPAVRADQGGAAFWASGSYAGYAAVPPSAGWSLTTELYYYTGTAGAAIQRGKTLFLGLGSQTAQVLFTPMWTPQSTTWLGGTPSLSLSFGGAWNRTTASASLAVDGATAGAIGRSGSIVGGSDLSPQAQLAWTRGNHNWMTYLTGNIPSGAYENSRLPNVGLGHSALDAGGAYTYANARTGFEASATVGFTHNGVNSTANYRSGLDSHLDWEVSQAVSARVQLGLVGYVYHQITADDGSGAHLGSFQSRVDAAGVEFNYAFPVRGQEWSTSVRGYWEFDAEHRLQGHSWYATLNLPLWAPPPGGS